MNLKILSDNDLLELLQGSCANEKDQTLRVLKILLEVDERRLYLPRGHSSLFAYCTKVLGYSENEAFLRIQGMRLMRELPSVEQKLANGEISLTAAAKAQTVFRRVEKQTEGLDRTRKAAIVEELCGVNVREAEQRLANHFPQHVKSESQRPVNADLVQLSLTVSTELLGKFERLKGLLAHKNPEGRLDRLLELMADFTLSQLDPMENMDPAASAAASSDRSGGAGPREGTTGASAASSDASAAEAAGTAKNERMPSSNDAGSLWPNKARSRHIPKVVRWSVWQRAGACCEYVDDQTGTRCGSRFKLQIDHIHPFAAGGGHDEANLQLLCASHNLWRSNGVYQLAHQRLQQMQSTVHNDGRWQRVGS